MNHSALIAKFKVIFENQKQNIFSAHAQLGEEFQVKVEDLSDESDHASAVIEQGMKMSLRQREVQFLKKLDVALEKIASGTFGICECCEEPIELKRLEARPTADLCLNCKEIEEANEDRTASGRRPKIVGLSLVS